MVVTAVVVMVAAVLAVMVTEVHLVDPGGFDGGDSGVGGVLASFR